jgi:hypothetical protein
MMIFSTRLMSEEPPLGLRPGDIADWFINEPVLTETVSGNSPPF